MKRVEVYESWRDSQKAEYGSAGLYCFGAEGPGWVLVYMNAFRALLLILIAMHAIVAAPPRGEAATAAEIDADVNATLHSFDSQIQGARELGNKAAAILVFPSVVKAGIGIGGEYGEGLLIIRGRPGGYYNLISASFGFQLGVQARSVIIMFMTQEAFASFEGTYGWKVGVDGSVAIITIGAGGSIDTENLTSPVIGFILDPQGLMYNLTLEGSKISSISR
jgi:lipid-binding SYLF domain-containing protein